MCQLDAKCVSVVTCYIIYVIWKCQKCIQKWPQMCHILSECIIFTIWKCQTRVTKCVKCYMSYIYIVYVLSELYAMLHIYSVSNECVHMWINWMSNVSTYVSKCVCHIYIMNCMRIECVLKLCSHFSARQMCRHMCHKCAKCVLNVLYMSYECVQMCRARN